LNLHEIGMSIFLNFVYYNVVKKQLKWYEERSYILDYVVICSSITGPTVPL